MKNFSQLSSEEAEEMVGSIVEAIDYDIYKEIFVYPADADEDDDYSYENELKVNLIDQICAIIEQYMEE